MSERFTEAPVSAPNSTPETPDNTSREQTKFDEIANKLMAHTENLEPTEQLETMRGFVSQLLKDAESGGIKNSAGESYSHDDIEQQLIKFIDGMDNPKNEHGESTNPLMYITRADGLRSMFLKFANNEETYTPLRQAIVELKVNRMNAEGQRVEGLNSPETESHEAASKDLGQVAIAEAMNQGVTSKQEAFKALSEQAQNEINDLRRAQTDHRQSEKDGDYSMAARDKELVNRLKGQLSSEAKQFLEEQYGW